MNKPQKRFIRILNENNKNKYWIKGGELSKLITLIERRFLLTPREIAFIIESDEEKIIKIKKNRLNLQMNDTIARLIILYYGEEFIKDICYYSGEYRKQKIINKYSLLQNLIEFNYETEDEKRELLYTYCGLAIETIIGEINSIFRLQLDEKIERIYNKKIRQMSKYFIYNDWKKIIENLKQFYPSVVIPVRDKKELYEEMDRVRTSQIDVPDVSKIEIHRRNERHHLRSKNSFIKIEIDNEMKNIYVPELDEGSFLDVEYDMIKRRQDVVDYFCNNYTLYFYKSKKRD